VGNGLVSVEVVLRIGCDDASDRDVIDAQSHIREKARGSSDRERIGGIDRALKTWRTTGRTEQIGWRAENAGRVSERVGADCEGSGTAGVSIPAERESDRRRVSAPGESQSNDKRQSRQNPARHCEVFPCASTQARGPFLAHPPVLPFWSRILEARSGARPTVIE
jgi:hypothetical protein